MKKHLLVIFACIVAGSIVQPAWATEDNGVVETTTETAPTETSTEIAISPTFADETTDTDTAKFRFGHNLVVVGNNLNSTDEVETGIALMAGNNLSIAATSEYGFIAGNTINFTGQTLRDLYLAGNTVTIDQSATIGRDVYAAGNIVSVYADIPGDLSISADTVVLRDITVGGNLNLDVANLRIEGQVKAQGVVTYNDNAEVSGLSQITADKIETYHVEELDAGTALAMEIYSAVLSAVGIFIVMVIIAACYGQKFHERVAAVSEIDHLGTTLVTGLVALIVVPMLALLALISLIGAPLGIVAIALYLIGIYLAKGFVGLWIGHLLLEKAFKAKGNVYLEALLGIVVLTILKLVPGIGELVTFLSIVLGLGLILSCLKPDKSHQSGKKSNVKKAVQA